MHVLNPKNNNMYTVEFIIVKGQCKSILGLKTCEELELLTVNRQNISLATSQSTNTQGLPEQDKGTRPNIGRQPDQRKRTRSISQWIGITIDL